MTEIPIQFDYKDSHYKGILTEVSGVGQQGAHWHLYVDSYYMGQITWSKQYHFRFTSNVWEDNSLNDILEFYIISWYD